MSNKPVLLTPEQAEHLRNLLLVVGVSSDIQVNVQALNMEFVKARPKGPHNQETVSEWIDEVVVEARQALVPVIWNNEDSRPQEQHSEEPETQH